MIKEIIWFILQRIYCVKIKNWDNWVIFFILELLLNYESGRPKESKGSCKINAMSRFESELWWILDLLEQSPWIFDLVYTTGEIPGFKFLLVKKLHTLDHPELSSTPISIKRRVDCSPSIQSSIISNVCVTLHISYYSLQLNIWGCLIPFCTLKPWIFNAYI